MVHDHIQKFQFLISLCPSLLKNFKNSSIYYIVILLGFLWLFCIPFDKLQKVLEGRTFLPVYAPLHWVKYIGCSIQFYDKKCHKKLKYFQVNHRIMNRILCPSSLKIFLTIIWMGFWGLCIKSSFFQK